jgi:asparagine synthase (glutamine-hydrolysing)
MGFVTPEECWMKNELRSFMLEIFSSPRFRSRPYWNANAVVQDYQEFLAGTSTYSPEIWRIACTELWLRKFIDVPCGMVQSS